MTAVNNIVYLQLFLKLNLILFSTATILISAAYYFFSYRVPAIKQSYNVVNLFFKGLNVFCYLCSFIFFVISFYLFFRLIEAYKIEVKAPSTFAYCNMYSLQLFAYRFEIDLFGFILLMLAYVVGFLSLLTLDTRLAAVNFNFFIYFNFFVIFVFLFVIANDIILFFFFYELLVLPSFFFIYFISYSKKAIQASLYFVIWTQVGSLLVLIAVFYVVSRSATSSLFNIRHCPFVDSEALFIFCLLFFGFGFKMPIWPFHYWLTKIHVEAPSGFSIYLSGFLVKSAMFGFYRLANMLTLELHMEPFVFIALMGVADASLKMWGQSDLKKLVAYCTIQEMNLILITLLWGDAFIAICGFFFSAVHAFLSSLMFYLVDCIYRRYHVRSLFAVSGIFSLFPNLGLLILFMVIFFAGLPGTVKFACEFYIFNTLLSGSVLSSFFLITVLNFFGLVGFSKGWFNAIFGLPSTDTPLISIDLSKKEFLISFFSIFFLIFSTFFFFFIL